MLCPLAEYGILKVSGAHAERFLQGQLTIDVSALAEACAYFCALCNNKGRVLASLYVIKTIDGYQLLMRLTSMATVLTHFKKYVVAAKVQFDDQSTMLHVFGVTGESKVALLTAIPRIKINQQQQWSLVIADPDTTTTLIETVGKNNTIDETMWREYMINTGIAEIQPGTAGLFTPHALNYPKFGAVSLTKGCYIGQEIIARMHYRGQSKEQCIHVDLTKQSANNSAPMPGDVINNTEGKMIATIADGYFNSAKQVYSALAVMQSELANQLDAREVAVTINSNGYVLVRKYE